jgi:hypothetical protein
MFTLLRRLFFILLVIFIYASPSQAARLGIMNSEGDGSPGDVYAYKVVWPNGTISITNGVLTFTEAGGGGTVNTSGTPVANDFARFTDVNTIEGRNYVEVRDDLSLPYNYTGWVGGAAGDLDLKAVATISDGDIAFGYEGTVETFHIYSASEAGGESVPYIIIPDDNVSGTGAWVIPDKRMQNLLVAGTMTAGADGFTVDDDGDTVVLTLNTGQGAYELYEMDQDVKASDINTLIDAKIDDTAYNATSWDNNTEAATKNAIRDKIETLGGGGDVTAAAAITADAIVIGDDGAKGVKESTIKITSGDDLEDVGSISFLKESGVPGFMGVHEGNSTDILMIGFEGPASIAATLRFKFPSDLPEANEIWQFGAPAGDPAVSQISWGSPGAETNSLETTITGIADTEFFVGDGADSGAFVVMSGAGTLANDGTLTLTTDSVDYDNTTGSVKALTPVHDDADNFAANFTGANLYGGTFVANGTGDVDLPAPVSGMNFTVITFGDIAVSILPDAGDDLILDGVQLDDNHDALNGSSAGDIIVIQFDDVDGWLAESNGWTEVTD